MFHVGVDLQSYDGPNLPESIRIPKRPMRSCWECHGEQALVLKNLLSCDVLRAFALTWCRLALALWLLHAMKCVWVVEQPGTSLLGRHPRMRQLLKVMRIFRCSFWMCKYGSPSPERLKLFSNSAGIRFFRTSPLTKKQRERLPVRLASTRVRADGTKSYSGNKHLKDSQTWP